MGQLLGHQLQPREIARLAYNAGWVDAYELAVAVAVCLAESQGYERAINENPDGSRDRGIWQLNTVHKDITDEIAYDPEQATAWAFKLWSAKGNFSDWAAYKSGVYLHDSYVGRAVVGVANFLGDDILALPVPDWNGAPYVHRFKTPIADFWFRVAEQLAYNEQAAKLLGWTAATKAKVTDVQKKLAAARTVAKATRP